MVATWQIFNVLGIQPELGRFFNAAEGKPGGGSPPIISDRLWRTTFATDAHVIGRSATLGGRNYRVIGVAPPRFRIRDADPQRRGDAIIGNVLARAARRAPGACGYSGRAGLRRLRRGVATQPTLGVEALDPITYVIVVIIVAVAALLAALLPALRATRVDPVVALRQL